MIQMGQFSWMCADCGDQILSEGDSWECFKCEEDFEGKEPVMLLVPDFITLDDDTTYNLRSHHYGFHEDDYEGYGVFGGMDAYTLLARLNRPEQCPSMLTPTGKLKRGKSFIKALFDREDEDAMNVERGLGIHLDFGGAKLLYPIKVVHTRCGTSYSYCGESDHDPDQGWQSNRREEGSLEICDRCY